MISSPRPRKLQTEIELDEHNSAHHKEQGVVGYKPIIGVGEKSKLESYGDVLCETTHVNKYLLTCRILINL